MGSAGRGGWSGLALRGGVAGFGASKPHSELALCLNNLRQIGRAFQIWGNDHEEGRPWRVPQSLGGTMPASGTKPGNVWYEMAWVSNELATPKILVCPSDDQVTRVATHFSAVPDGGFLHPNYRGNAVSYFIGLDVLPDYTSLPLAGDRNFRVDGVNAACSCGIKNAAYVFNTHKTPSIAGWTNGIHELQGNLLLNDGAVRMLATLRAAWANPTSKNAMHVLMPR